MIPLPAYGGDAGGEQTRSFPPAQPLQHQQHASYDQPNAASAAFAAAAPQAQTNLLQQLRLCQQAEHQHQVAAPRQGLPVVSGGGQPPTQPRQHEVPPLPAAPAGGLIRTSHESALSPMGNNATAFYFAESPRRQSHAEPTTPLGHRHAVSLGQDELLLRQEAVGEFDGVWDYAEDAGSFLDERPVPRAAQHTGLVPAAHLQPDETVQSPPPPLSPRAYFSAAPASYSGGAPLLAAFDAADAQQQDKTTEEGVYRRQPPYHEPPPAKAAARLLQPRQQQAAPPQQQTYMSDDPRGMPVSLRQQPPAAGENIGRTQEAAAQGSDIRGQPPPPPNRHQPIPPPALSPASSTFGTGGGAAASPGEDALLLPEVEDIVDAFPWRGLSSA